LQTKLHPPPDSNEADEPVIRDLFN